jgi:hypothetical protein
MEFTDKRARKIVNSLKCYECKESIESYPEDERDGKEDLAIIREEREYFIYMFEEVDGALSGDLEEAREILRETKNGKVNPIIGGLNHPRLKYSEWDIKRAKNTVSEVRQLKRILKELS